MKKCQGVVCTMRQNELVKWIVIMGVLFYFIRYNNLKEGREGVIHLGTWRNDFQTENIGNANAFGLDMPRILKEKQEGYFSWNSHQDEYGKGLIRHS